MDEGTIKAILKNIGVPMFVITFLFFLAVCAYLYFKFLETKKLTLEIRQLEYELETGSDGG